MKRTILCPLCRREYLADLPEEWQEALPCSRCFAAPQRVRMTRWLIYLDRIKANE